MYDKDEKNPTSITNLVQFISKRSKRVTRISFHFDIHFYSILFLIYKNNKKYILIVYVCMYVCI